MQGRVLGFSLGEPPTPTLDKAGQAWRARPWVPQPHPTLLSGNEVSSLSHPTQLSRPEERGPGGILAPSSPSHLSLPEEGGRDPWLQD